MAYVLGVDGGGTKCDAVLMDTEGNVKGWGRGGPTHGLYVGSEVARQSVRDAVNEALGELRPKLARIAGVGVHAGFDELLGDGSCRQGYVPCGEVEMGFATVLTTHGILVLSGTGSFVHGRTPDGRHKHEGGNGPIIADEGSAYHIGILGIRAAFRHYYSEARHTTLAEAVPAAMGVENLHDVFHLLYVDRVGRTQIASVAATVNEQAERGDAVAIGVLRRSAGELGELLVEVIHELEMGGSDACMVATGSVAMGSRIFWEYLCEIAAGVAPGLRPVQPRVRPVIGACLRALRDMGAEWNEALIDRIVQTQAPFLAQNR